eukprot:771511-Prymnesium_polylepis.1
MSVGRHRGARGHVTRALPHPGDRHIHVGRRQALAGRLSKRRGEARLRSFVIVLDRPGGGERGDST